MNRSQQEYTGRPIDGATATVIAPAVPVAGTGLLAERRGLRLIVRMLLVMMVVLTLVRVFILEPYAIPTGSMKPTILEGDVLLVNKLPYTIRSLRHIPFTYIEIPYLELPGLGRLERGDIVVFDRVVPATGAVEQLVKRCVAVAGDTIRLTDGRITVNGVEVAPVNGNLSGDRRSAVRRSDAVELLRDGDGVVVPFKGFEIEMDSIAAAHWSRLIANEGVTIEYRNNIVFLDGLPATHYRFQRDYFFALGDNSGDSYDSRFFGFVPVDDLIGQASIIYWSREPHGDIRWNRIGTLVR